MNLLDEYEEVINKQINFKNSIILKQLCYILNSKKIKTLVDSDDDIWIGETYNDGMITLDNNHIACYMSDDVCYNLKDLLKYFQIKISTQTLERFIYELV